MIQNVKLSQATAENIKISTNGEGRQTVNARDLHEFLGVKTAFKDWVARRIEGYSFTDGMDFCSFLSESTGGPSSQRINHSEYPCNDRVSRLLGLLIVQRELIDE